LGPIVSYKSVWDSMLKTELWEAYRFHRSHCSGPLSLDKHGHLAQTNPERPAARVGWELDKAGEVLEDAVGYVVHR
jgi:hypothetical protein